MGSESEAGEKTNRRWLEKAGDWVKVSILPSVLTCVFGVVGTLWFTDKNPHLTVTTSDTVRFRGDTNRVNILNVTIRSDGSKEARAVECIIPVAKPSEVIVTPNHLNHTVESAGGSTKVKVPILNPSEQIFVSVLSSADDLPDIAPVVVRGDGVTGLPPPPPGATPYTVSWATTVLAVVLSGFTVWLMRRVLTDRKQVVKNYQSANEAMTQAVAAVREALAMRDRANTAWEEAKRAQQDALQELADAKSVMDKAEDVHQQLLQREKETGPEAVASEPPSAADGELGKKKPRRRGGE